MLQNISVLHFLIFAIVVGFIAAIIYTNIQRTALFKFVLFLVSKCIHSPESAVTIKEIGLTPLEGKIASSAVLKTYGLRKCVCVIKDKQHSDDKLEVILEKKENNDKYYLTECDTEELVKKYSFKTMPNHLVILFIAALIIVSVAVTAAVDWLIGYVSIPKTEKSDEVQSEQSTQTESKTDIEENIETPISPIPDGTKPEGPKIPV